MTTLTLQVENPSILAHLKEALKAFHGVKIVGSSNDFQSVTDMSWEEVPNTLTLAAMKEAESGKDAGRVCMDDLESFIASMQ